MIPKQQYTYTTNSMPSNSATNSALTDRTRARLQQLETMANMRVSDPNVQFRFLREVARFSPQVVIERVECGRFASNDVVFKEYLKALVTTSKIDQASMSDVMKAYNMSAALGMTAATNTQTNYENSSGQQGGQGFNQNNGGFWGNTHGGGYGGNENIHPGIGAAFGGAGSSAGGGGNEAQPLYVQMVEGGIKTQLWRTLRVLAFGFLVIAGFNMLVDGKGVPRGLGFNNEVKPVIEDTGKGFDDVMGANEAKEELQEIVAYLRDPSQFTRLGGKLPKGVLLTGPPGTGKTLLAKAIAGEAGTPFFYASGSEFEEMYVGVGARRVRDLFDAAKKAAPCIVFIDEIDAIGSTRALKEQQALKMTLNQLLVELDGFKESEGVIIVGATNFPELLDPALIRPGRFDRNVSVPLPDLRDRIDILDLYLSKIPCAENVESKIIARGTPGASGAELANLVNIAAIRASTKGAELVSLEDLEYAKDKILMGSERKSAIIPDAVRKVTSYHEGGHALCALFTKDAMPIHKATIMPRGQALGMVHQLPEESDMLQQTKSQMFAELDVCMGGRVAEELMFGADNVTSGASSDIQQATSIARRMVERYGMGSDASCGIMFAPSKGSDSQPISDETKKKIDAEVQTILEASYLRAMKLLSSHKTELKRLAKALLEYESLTKEQIELVIKGKPLPVQTSKLQKKRSSRK